MRQLLFPYSDSLILDENKREERLGHFRHFLVFLEIRSGIVSPWIKKYAPFFQFNANDKMLIKFNVGRVTVRSGGSGSC